ncbi:MFS transporter [Urechidicola sp. KH5]
MLQKGDKKLINAWAFYDWANSVYSLVISTAVFPIYYTGVTESFANVEGDISFLGTQWNPTTLYDYTLAFSFLIVAFLSPILSGIADYVGNKLKFLKRFCLLGSLSVMSLYFFEGEQTLWVGLLFTVLASIGFWGSIVFYNAYLPEVAYPEDQDRVSAKGFMHGYVGSIILLILCLVLVEMHETFGIASKGFATRLSFILVGLWWLGFAQITYRRLPVSTKKEKLAKEVFWNGLKELKKVLNELKDYPSLKIFLISFFMFSVGVQTIILMAGIFGSKELQLPTSDLILVILLVQVVAIFGAYIFSRLSSKYGNIKALKLTIIIWGLVCLIAFILDKSQPNVHYYFYGLGALIGLVLGAIQSLSRSTYSKLLPETDDHATYFSFYDVTEKLAIVFGMFIFGLLIALTGSMQYSVLFLAIFFVLSFIILSFMKKTKHVQ